MGTPTGMSGEGYFAKDSTIVGLINEWSVSKSRDEVDITSFSEGGVDARDYEPGLMDWTMDITGFIDFSDTEQMNLDDAMDDGTKVTVWAALNDSGNYYEGEAFVTSDDITNPVDEVADVSMSLRGKDKLVKENNESA